MSQQLHIQLTRYQKTTRRPRWVVWLPALSFLLIFIFIYQITTLFLTRNTVFSAAPENTKIAIQLLVNEKTLPILSKILNTVPLISNRSFTLKDIQPFVHGEIGWFFHEDGGRSIAVRSKKNELPTKLFDANQIIVQQINSDVFLLTDKLQPIGGIKSKHSLGNLIPSFKQKLGMFYEKGKKSVVISATKDGIVIPLSNQEAISTFDSKIIQENTYIALKLPLLEKENFDMYQTLFKDQNILRSFFSTDGFLMMKEIENPKFLLVSKSEMNDEEKISFLQTEIALKNPSIITKKLPDNTQMQEFVSDPSLVSVEQKMIEGLEFYKASTSNEAIFASKKDDLIISNNEEMIRIWLKNEQNNKVLKICDANVAFLSLNEFIESNSFTTEFYKNDVLRTLAANFRVASLEKSWNSTKLRLCF
ncbi:hypothetical protein HYV69_01135 [Candidatus Uhrbacteria bacterium]|nr:hypothetical protein [Candidatus Uhrbacteria bacterium]